MSAFHYNYAIVCRIPQSFKYSASKQDADDDIDVERARAEHKELIETLRKCEVRVVELQEDEDYPDCTFLDDCAVVIGGTALITRPSEKTRHGEVKEIRKILKQDMKLKVLEIEDPDAIVNGGDVFFTGKEIFVGISEGQTNEIGANAVAAVFSEYNVTPVRMKTKARLKSLVCMAGRDIIAVGNSQAAFNVLTHLRATAQYSYKILKLDTDTATNMLYVNGRLIHRTRNEVGEKCYSILDEKITYVKHKVELTEISKASGTLTSLVLFVDKHRYRKEIISNLNFDDLTMHTTTEDM